MLTDEVLFVCWKWNQKGCRSSYTAQHANVWNRMVRRYYSGPLRTVCITDDARGVEFDTYPLWDTYSDIANPNGAHLPSCYRRLRLFSREITDALGVPEGGRVVSMDLDIVIVSPIDKMFDHPAPFVGWKRVSPNKPVGYNGSMFMFRAGQMEFLWTSFEPIMSPIRARRAKQYGSDQGWISYALAGDAPGWSQNSGMYSFSAHVQGRALPRNARIVSFNGKWKPWMPQIQRSNDWVRRHWC